MEEEEISDRKKGGWVISLAAIVLIGAVLLFVVGSSGGLTGTSIYSDEKLHNKDPSGVGEAKKFTLLTTDSGIEPSQIKAEKNETIILQVSASDKGQGIEIPAYGIEENSIEGKMKEIKFKADKAGEFNMGCGSYCGDSVEDMEGTLIVRE